MIHTVPALFTNGRAKHWVEAAQPRFAHWPLLHSTKEPDMHALWPLATLAIKAHYDLLTDTLKR